MRTASLVLVCLACAGHGRRVQVQRTEPDSMKAFASLLHASNPAAGFQVGGARPVASAMKKPLGLRTAVKMQEEAAAPAPAPKMSEALPFVECPEHLDGTYAGDVGFDPLMFGAMGNLKWMREAELKHGRICMLATLGWILVDKGLRLPGFPEDITSLQAHDVTTKSGQMWLLFMLVAVFEAPMYIALPQMCLGETNREPGDYGFDPLGYKKSERYKNGFYSQAEIKNGRLAMLAFSGIVTVSALYQKPFPYF
mmetsp:Transcript_116099/g.189104  ORF Transcript_116099/g.189104 Transcript_116099/m.189104 type:complete len:253 (-) Transcript_116099:2-760(-)